MRREGWGGEEVAGGANDGGARGRVGPACGRGVPAAGWRRPSRVWRQGIGAAGAAGQGGEEGLGVAAGGTPGWGGESCAFAPVCGCAGDVAFRGVVFRVRSPPSGLAVPSEHAGKGNEANGDGDVVDVWSG